MKRNTVAIVLERYRAGAKGTHGNPAQGFGPKRIIEGCVVVPRGDSTEPAQSGRNAVIVGLTVYAPHGTEVGARDRVTYDGYLWQVEGEPGDWGVNTFTGRPGVVEFALKRVDG